MLCMDLHLDPLLLLRIETPHLVHTHSRSSLYIYNKPIGALDSFEVLVFMMCESGYFSYNGYGIMV